MARSSGHPCRKSSMPNRSAPLLIWLPCAPSLKWRIGLTVKMICLPLHSPAIRRRASVTSADESLSRMNSDAGLFRQFETTEPEAIFLKHHAVPSVMMILLHEAKYSRAAVRIPFALLMNSSLDPRANDVWWENEHQRSSPAPICMQSSGPKRRSDARSSMLCSIEMGLYSVPKGFTHASNPKSESWRPMLSEKQLPSINILSSYEMPTLHFSSATGVCNLSMVQIYQRFFTSFRMTREKCYI